MPGDVASLWMSGWHWHPQELVGIALLAQAYLLGIGPLRVRYRWADRVEPRYPVFFFLGLAVIGLAVATPLHEASEVLFSAHMVQHMLLGLVAPPLLLLGLPDWLLSPLLRYALLIPPLHFLRAPTRLMRLTVKHVPLLRIVRALTHPVVAGVLFIGVFSLWHFPQFYEAAVRIEAVHILEHATVLATAVFAWWRIVNPTKDVPSLSYPLQMIYLFLLAVGTTPLFGVLVFADSPIYPLYAAYLGEGGGYTAALDQQIGGLIMKMPYTFVFLAILLLVFIKWYRQEEAKSAQDQDEEDDGQEHALWGYSDESR